MQVSILHALHSQNFNHSTQVYEMDSLKILFSYIMSKIDDLKIIFVKPYLGLETSSHPVITAESGPHSGQIHL